MPQLACLNLAACGVFEALPAVSRRVDMAPTPVVHSAVLHRPSQPVDEANTTDVVVGHVGVAPLLAVDDVDA